MGKNFAVGSKTELRNTIKSLHKSLTDLEADKTRSFSIIAALLNRNNGLVEFTKHEFDEVKLNKRMDVIEKPEIGKYILKWVDDKAENVSELILGKGV